MENNDQNDYPIVIRFGYTNYKRRWSQQTVKNAGHLLKKKQGLLQLS